MALTILAGDIGGTKTILRLAEVLQSPGPAAGPAVETLHEERFASQGFPDLAPMVQQFLRNAAKLPRHMPVPAKACFGIAGPVVGTASELTNLGWRLDAGRLSRELGIKPGETTEDLNFTLETVNCVGACALGPIAIVDGEYSGQMKSDKVKPLLEKYS